MNSNCYFCGEPVELLDHGIYYHRCGWTEQRRGGGANKLSLAGEPSAVAHGHCVERESKKIARGQGVLGIGTKV